MCCLIPSELLELILQQLPAKDLVRFRCVNKLWNSLITDPQFAKNHLRFHSPTNNHHHLLATFTKDDDTNNQNLFLWDCDYPLHSLFNPIPATPSRTRSSSRNRIRRIRDLVGSCDGILCLVTELRTVLLWNPTINEFKELPLFDNHSQMSYTKYGFGCDRVANTYKVVALSLRRHGAEDDLLPAYTVEVRIYTLGTDLWRRNSDYSDKFTLLESGTFVSGTLNWISLPVSADSSGNIVSLDLGNECFRQISLPNEFKKLLYHASLAVLRDCLCVVDCGTVFDSGYWQYCDLWLMKEYGNAESWTKLFSIYLPNKILSPSLCVKALYMDDDDQILLHMPPGIVIYNCKYDTSKLKIEKIQACSFPNVYVQSLISPCP